MKRSRALWLDLAERLFVLALYGWLVARMVEGFRAGGGPGSLLLLPSEGLVVVFVLLRRRTEKISPRPHEWLLALLATCAALLVTPIHRPPPIHPMVGSVLMIMGMLIQLHAKVHLGRSFGLVAAHRGLSLGGPYKLVRHPMYAGYMLSHLGYLAFNPTWWNFALYAIGDSLQIPRLLAEERLLANDEHYRRYQSTVRYRLFPGLF